MPSSSVLSTPGTKAFAMLEFAMMSRAPYRASISLGVVMGGVLLLSLQPLGCTVDYSLEPTFCDDWCHVTLQPDCGEDPEDCVEDCELTKASEDCFSLQAALLHCYEGYEASVFSCASRGNQSESRVQPEVCQSERDALFECRAPGIEQCLNICRVTQQGQLQRVAVEDTELFDFRQLTVDAGLGVSCPALDQPCEGICWSVFGLQGAGLQAAGVATVAGEDSDLSEALSCLQTSLLGCFAPSTGTAANSAEQADAGVSALRGRPPETIAQTLARCGGVVQFRQ